MPEKRKGWVGEWATRAAADLGPWLLYLAGVAAMLLVGSLSDDLLGDYWSYAIFLPIWGLGQGLIQIFCPRVGRTR
jgi:hypothetical protein